MAGSDQQRGRTLHDPDEPDSDTEANWAQKYIAFPIIVMVILMMFAPHYLLLAVFVGLAVATLLFYPGEVAGILSSALSDLASALPALEAIDFYQLGYHAAFIVTVATVTALTLGAMMWRLADDDEWERLRKFDRGEADEQ